MKDGLSIGRVARLSGVPIHTVRFYEKLGLLSAVSRQGPGRYRVFNEDCVASIRFILRAKALMFSLEEIGGLLALRSLPAAKSCAAGLARAKLAAIDAEQTRLRDISATLSKISQACADVTPHVECPVTVYLTTAGEPPGPPARFRPSPRPNRRRG